MKLPRRKFLHLAASAALLSAAVRVQYRWPVGMPLCRPNQPTFIKAEKQSCYTAARQIASHFPHTTT
jgi:hypothetical protein